MPVVGECDYSNLMHEQFRSNTSKLSSQQLLLRRRQRILGGEAGQAVVELALVLVPALLVVLGIVIFGRVMNYNEQATHLVNEAVRYAAVNQVPASANGTLGAWVRSQADSSELANGTGDVQGTPQVCLSYPNGSGVGNPVTVSMSFRFHWLPLISSVGSSTITRTATMRIEVQPTSTLYAATCS